MRFTSLIVELIRARPRLVVWLVVLLQAGLWLILPLLLYRSPPRELATLLAFGPEYQVGTDLGPPLAFLLAHIAVRAPGNHVLGVYLLAQRVVRMVERGRTVAADDVGCDRTAAARRRIRRCHPARAAHADVARSALFAAGDRRPGATLSDLAAPLGYSGRAAVTRDRRSQ